MSSKLAVAAELDKLAVTLNRQRAELDFLQDVPSERLRDFRIAVYEQLFREDRLVFARMAWIVRRLPARIVDPLATRAFGPAITARVAAELPAGRAVRIVQRLDTEFLADVCVHLDPRRTRDVIARLPRDRIIAVSRLLIERRDYMTLSRFVEFFDDASVREVLDATDDEAALLQVAFYMGAKNRLDHLFRLLPMERFERLIVLAEERPRELLPALLSLIIHVGYALQRELLDLVAAQDESILAGYVRAADEQGLWEDVLPVVAAMREPARRTVVNLAILREPAVQERIIESADAHDQWGLVLPMIELMDDANREAVAGIVASRPPVTLESAAAAALTGEHWETLLDLARRMPAAKQHELATIVGALGSIDPGLVTRIGRRAAALGCAPVLAFSG